MSTDSVGEFEDSLQRVGVAGYRTDPQALGAVLDEVVVEPAVGTPLPGDASLPDSVTTDPTPAQLDAATTGVTAAWLGIADYGSVVIRSSPDATEQVSLYPERHVAVLEADHVVSDMAEAFQQLGPELRENQGSAVIATGPSATSDMGELVTGVHGPKTVDVVVLLDEEGADG